MHDGRTLLYRASKHDCDAYPLRAKCCTGVEARKIPRDLHEDARDVARRKMKTKAFLKSRDLRKRVEMRFAHLKTHHRFERSPARPVRRPRRVPSRRDRTEPQDAGAAPCPAATTARLRVSGVALVGGVCVEADAHMGEARKPPSALHLPDRTGNQVPAAPTADFFDSIERTSSVSAHRDAANRCGVR